jgi:hypothetical protein
MPKLKTKSKKIPKKSETNQKKKAKEKNDNH